MAFYSARYRARAESFFREQKIRRFKLLEEKIFLRIRRYKLEAGILDELGSFKLRYDLTEIKSSPYYAEASEYIRTDLPPYITRPEELEKLVTDFNNEVDEFMLNVIPSSTHEILRTVATISNAKKGALPPENSISLENIMPSIQRYWILNRDFDTNYQNGSFTIDGEVVAKIPPELQDSFIAAIQKLKTDSKLFHAMNGNLTWLRRIETEKISPNKNRRGLV